MYRKILNIGDRFGDWIVIEQLPTKKNGYITYKARCICGSESNLSGNYLRSFKSPCCRSCSAKKRTPKGKNNKFFKHGASMIGNPLRSTNKTWVVMKQRCNNPNSRDYKNYGGRGITYCKKWETFEGFIKDMGIRPKGLSLDRIDNNGNYCKENCRWATRKMQNNNRRDNTFFIIDGVRITRTEIQDQLKWTRDMYRRRHEKYGEKWILDLYKAS
jgi:hypothetical protein